MVTGGLHVSRRVTLTGMKWNSPFSILMDHLLHYTFPEATDWLTVDMQDVLTSVQPATATGRTYMISRKVKSSTAASALKKKLKA